MKRITNTQFTSMLFKLERGSRIYINAINLTVTQIDILKQFVSRGDLQPDLKELTMMIKPEYHKDFFDGDKIAPQMTYIKCRDAK